MDGFHANFIIPNAIPLIEGPDGTRFAQGGISGGTSRGPSGLYYLDWSEETDVHGNSQTISDGTTDSIGRTLVTQQTTANQIVYTIPDSKHGNRLPRGMSRLVQLRVNRQVRQTEIP
jgi:hypothetical protein